MAPAGIEQHDGMMYVGAEPWHGLGVKLPHLATSAEALEAASLDWEVEMEPIYVRAKAWNGDHIGMVRVPNKMAVGRRDIGRVFYIGSEGYTPVQNRDAFGFFDGVVAAGEAVYETAGSLFNGRRVWIMAKLPDDLNLSGDVLNKYILLSNSHDGTAAFEMRFSIVRVVCYNTLSAALSDEGSRMFRAKHTSGVMGKVNEARDVMGLADAHFALFMRGAERLVEARMAVAEVEEMAFALLKVPDPKKATARATKTAEEIADLFRHGRGNNGETAWDAYNAVTEYVDHVRPVRQSKATEGETPEGVRLHNAWFTGGARMKDRAWNYLASRVA